MTIRMTIIGLGQIGTSIGLALKDNPYQIVRIGNDSDPHLEQKALKMGALDETIHNLHTAVSDADIIVLATPMDEVRETLATIVPDLKPGAVVLDTSPLKTLITQWVKDLLPAERYVVSFAPSLNPEYLYPFAPTPETARPDLFKGGVFVITSPPHTHGDALKLASDLAVLLGAKPYFADPYEADGLMAAIHGLPQLSAAALITTITRQPGWREARKLAGRTFVEATEPITHLDDHTHLGESILLNRENLLRLLDDYIAVLQEVRIYLETADRERLASLLKEASQARSQWWQERQKGDWDATPSAEIPSSGQFFARMFGLGGKPTKKS
ncbi:prephenate dehydrogenase [uncultured Thermanaerothrix sp.]|uniref:prephenate dehydrogenase n=1 Tax=uncultured Thermanaerothrix sp. TaxID=1195149 RepID=UPI00260C23D2|nr:prephenate dehydrogenase [uncultured Thermanaerothrix sp.]